MKRKAGFCLFLAFLICLLCGCSKLSGYEAHSPDTVMMTVEGEEIYWKEFFYFLHYVYSESYEETEAWDEGLREEILEYVKNEILYYHALWGKAEELGISTLKEADKERLDALFVKEMEEAGGEEKYQEYLASYYMDKDFLYYMYSVRYYLDFYLLEHFFGERAQNFSDEDTQIFAEDYGIAQAKHILIKTVDDAGNPLEGEELAAKRALAEDLLAQIASYGGDDLSSFFDGLSKEHNEDLEEGLAEYPNGYLFGQGVMQEAFYTATLALSEFEISELVETDSGYYIIMRMPCDLDGLVLAGGADEYTLRQWAAFEAMENIQNQWITQLSVSYSPEYEDLNLNQIFPRE